MSFVNHFKETYYQKLLTPNPGNPIRNRADSLLKVFEILEQQNKGYYTIIETGCIRPDHGDNCFGDDGCASIIFDDFTLQHEPSSSNMGNFTTVDVSKSNCDYALRILKSSCTRAICSDSVSFLYLMNPKIKIDVLYLDSYDVLPGNYHDSSLHHLMELTAAMNNLKSDTLILIDDYDAFFDGGKTRKGVYIKQFLDKINAEIIHEDYQLLFRLPNLK